MYLCLWAMYIFMLYQQFYYLKVQAMDVCKQPLILLLSHGEGKGHKLIRKKQNTKSKTLLLFKTTLLLLQQYSLSQTSSS